MDTHPVEERCFTLTVLHLYARNNVQIDERVGRSLFQGWQYDAPLAAQADAQAGIHDAPVY